MSEREPTLLSELQHFAFCRQWALILIEQQWEDNERIVDGELFHTRATIRRNLSPGAIF